MCSQVCTAVSNDLPLCARAISVARAQLPAGSAVAPVRHRRARFHQTLTRSQIGAATDGLLEDRRVGSKSSNSLVNELLQLARLDESPTYVVEPDRLAQTTKLLKRI